MTSTSEKAFTLVEIIIATALASIIGIAAFTLYRGGVKSSLSGVANLEILAEGRKTLAQIRDDLKHSCIPFHGGFSISFNDLLHVDFSNNRGLEGAEFSLLRFKRQAGFAKKGLPSVQYLLRPLLSVKYRLEASAGSDLLKLIRESDNESGQAEIKILSERVSFFRMAPIKVTGPGKGENWFWNVSLQLSQHKESTSPTRPQNGIQTRGAGSLTFYDVVYSDFFNAMNNYRHSPRNWHTGLIYTPE
ncbi:MAG: prepilin-type N-terminal cleavage/methylation domain-containing protein [Candidatus Riflebacteria bacterium]|nr:prepilin-type N-terminal cleavage/methylation domain-containing protein [Candidatus Riflebacteria bacterium]